MYSCIARDKDLNYEPGMTMVEKFQEKLENWCEQLIIQE